MWHAGGVGSLILALNKDFPSGKGVALASIFASIFTRDWAADAFVAYTKNKHQTTTEQKTARVTIRSITIRSSISQI